MTAQIGALEEGELAVTLFVACYNEAENIVDTLDVVAEAMREVGLSYEVIVIDDGSSDGSPDLVEEYKARHPDLPLTLVVNQRNKGLAQNYIEAAFLGRGKYYRLICGDNVEPKETIVTVLNRIGEADIIIPYQVECPGRSIGRRMLSTTYTFLINTISGRSIRYYNGLAVHKRFNVMRWQTDYHGFGFQADLIARLLDEGATHVEVPVVARERVAGQSTAPTTVNLLSISHTFLDLSIRRVGQLLYPKRRIDP